MSYLGTAFLGNLTNLADELGLTALAKQNPADVSITGGSITGVTISNSTIDFSGLLTATAGIAGALNGTVGATTPSSGVFTTLSSPNIYLNAASDASQAFIMLQGAGVNKWQVGKQATTDDLFFYNVATGTNVIDLAGAGTGAAITGTLSVTGAVTASTGVNIPASSGAAGFKATNGSYNVTVFNDGNGHIESYGTPLWINSDAAQPVYIATSGVLTTVSGTLSVASTSTFTGLITANGGISGAHNGTTGATTPSTGDFTSLATTGLATLNSLAVSGQTIIGGISYLCSTENDAGGIPNPAFSQGVAVTWNATNGNGETDFWNMYTGDAASLQFRFFGRSSDTTANALFDIYGPGGTSYFYGALTVNGAFGATSLAAGSAAINGSLVLNGNQVYCTDSTLYLNYSSTYGIDIGTGGGGTTIHNGLTLTGTTIATSGSASSYGSLTIAGSKAGWAGINFSGAATLMVSGDTVGFYNSANTGWDWYWTGGTLSQGVIPAANISAGTLAGTFTFGANPYGPAYYATNSGAQFMAPGYMHYADGSNFYILLTGASTPTGTFNSLRPFAINLSTGNVWMEQGLSVGAGGISVTGGATIDALTVTGSVSFPAGAVPTVSSGTVIYFAAATAPTGYLAADGSSLSTTTYATLFGAIGYTFGGSGAAFNLPDMRGVFARGYDNGRGLDPSRVFGSYQADMFASHSHPVTSVSTGSNYATVGDSGVHPTSAVATTTSATGSAETAPKNVALLACIKY